MFKCVNKERNHITHDKKNYLGFKEGGLCREKDVAESRVHKPVAQLHRNWHGRIPNDWLNCWETTCRKIFLILNTSLQYILLSETDFEKVSSCPHPSFSSTVLFKNMWTHPLLFIYSSWNSDWGVNNFDSQCFHLGNSVLFGFMLWWLKLMILSFGAFYMNT